LGPGGDDSRRLAGSQGDDEIEKNDAA